ncbi:MAG TPA: ATPase, T2SS/T4P/T4SS family, partial [Aquabacterium sp.]|nr:ATPase, T2SS/T4P/T4SS family [Aquabacterium sp.]
MSAVLREVAPPLPIWTPDWAGWPLDQALRLRVVLAHDADEQAWALTPAVDDLRLREAVQRRVGRAVRWQWVSETELNELLAQGEQSFDARGSLVQLAQSDVTDEPTVQALSVDAISRQSSPVVKLLDATLFDALKAQASDLHLESTPQGMVVRHRLDGVMVQVDDIGSREVAEQLVSRLKVMAELDIGERRLPQDGRFKLRVQQSADSGVRDVDFRVSIMPSSYGEDAVLRILDRSRLSDEAQALSLEGLGFEPDDSDVIRRLAGKPYGMLLVTGPTG